MLSRADSAGSTELGTEPPSGGSTPADRPEFAAAKALSARGPAAVQGALPELEFAATPSVLPVEEFSRQPERPMDLTSLQQLAAANEALLREVLEQEQTAHHALPDEEDDTEDEPTQASFVFEDIDMTPFCGLSCAGLGWLAAPVPPPPTAVR